MTHPFHPLSGREFDFVYRRHNWDRDCVYFYDDEGKLTWIPAAWTDAVAAYPAVAVAEGRSAFRVDDLLMLVPLPGVPSQDRTEQPVRKIPPDV